MKNRQIRLISFCLTLFFAALFSTQASAQTKPADSVTSPGTESGYVSTSDKFLVSVVSGVASYSVYAQKTPGSDFYLVKPVYNQPQGTSQGFSLPNTYQVKVVVNSGCAECVKVEFF